MRRVCDVHEKMDATPLDFQPEHLLIILGELDAVRLLKVSLVSQLWRDVVAEIFRSRSAEPMEWRQGMTVTEHVDELHRDEDNERFWEKSADSLLCDTIAQCMPTNVSEEPIQGNQLPWRYLPSLALIFGTDSICEKLADRRNDPDGTCALADLASRYLPPQCTVVVVCATGIVGSNTVWRSKHEPGMSFHEVEDGESFPAVSILLAHLPPTVCVNWLGLGRNEETRAPRNKAETRTMALKARRVLRGRVGAHPNAWWQSTPARSRLHEVKDMDGSRLNQAQMKRLVEDWAGDDWTHRMGSRLLCFKTGPGDANPNGFKGVHRLLSSWSSDLISSLTEKTRLAAGGVALATAIRTGAHTVHSVVAPPDWLANSAVAPERKKSKLAALFDEAPLGSSGGSGGGDDGGGCSCTGGGSSSSSASSSTAGGATSVSGLVLSFSSAVQVSNCVLAQEALGRNATDNSLKLCLARHVNEAIESIPTMRDQYRSGYYEVHEADTLMDVVDSFAASHSVGPNEPLPAPKVAFVFTCNGRGQDEHNAPDVESMALARNLPGVPFAGFFAGGEIGPRFGPRSEFNAPEPGLAENEDLQFSCVVSMLA